MTEAHRETRILVQKVPMASHSSVLDLGIRGKVKSHAQTSSQISKTTELRQVSPKPSSFIQESLFVALLLPKACLRVRLLPQYFCCFWFLFSWVTIYFLGQEATQRTLWPETLRQPFLFPNLYSLGGLFTHLLSSAHACVPLLDVSAKSCSLSFWPTCPSCLWIYKPRCLPGSSYSPWYCSPHTHTHSQL